MENKRSLIGKIVLMIVMLVLSLITSAVIFKLNILPNKYLILFVIVMLVLNIIGGLCLMFKKWYLKIITGIMYIIITIISVLGIKYGTDTIDFLNKAFGNNNVEITTYNIVTLKNYEYEDIYDVEGNKLYYLTNDELINDAIKEVNKSITIETEGYEDLFMLYEDLKNEQIKFIIIDEAYLDILGESYPDIDEIISVIHEIDIKTEIKREEVDVKLKPINILLSGSDSRSNRIYNKSRSDVNMIITINPDTRKILLTSIPRDYYVDVYGKTGLKDKLTHAGIYGVETSRKTLENLFDIEIDYSVKIGFNAVVELVDLVGGVEVYSDKTFNSYHKWGWKVKKGINYMDGEKALAYARERYTYASGDRHRIKNQQDVLAAVIDKLSKSNKLLTRYDELLNSLSNFYVTDIPKGLITQVVKNQLEDMSMWEIESQSVSGSDASLPTYTAPRSKRYVMIPYEKDVKNAHDKIEEVLKG